MKPVDVTKASNIARHVRSAKQSPTERMAGVLKKISPANKAITQRKLFVEQYIYGTDSKDIFEHLDVDPVLRSELEGIYANPGRRAVPRGGIQPVKFIPDDLNTAARTLKRHELIRVHKLFLNKSSVTVLIEDKTNTITNKMYQNSIVSKVSKLSGADSIVTRNMDPHILMEIFPQSTNLSKHLQPLASSNTILKALCIPTHAIEATPEAFEVIRSQSPNFDPVAVILNLNASVRLNLDLYNSFKNETKKSQEPMNYDTLLQIAQRSHLNANNLMLKILTKVGQASFLNVDVDEHTICLTR